MGGLITGSCLEEEQCRPTRGKEGPRSDLRDLDAVKLLGDLWHVLALLSLGLLILQREDRTVRCVELPLALPFWGSGVLKCLDLRRGAPELSVGWAMEDSIATHPSARSQFLHPLPQV